MMLAALYAAQLVTRRLTRLPIRPGLRQKRTSGMRAKGIPKERKTWLSTRAREGSIADGEQDQGGGHRDRAAQEERDLAVDESLHHDLAGEGADARRRDARGEQRDAEDRGRCARRGNGRGR